MASHPNHSSTTSGTEPLDPLSVDGYKKIFDDCENISTAFVLLRTSYKDFEKIKWIDELQRAKLYDVYRTLTEYHEEIRQNARTSNNSIYVKLMEVYSLLECVLRNSLCRTYIPAYRTINMDCGRYRCYIGEREELLLKQLGFRSIGNLLTYSELDERKTVGYALTCVVLWLTCFEKLNPSK